MADVTVGIDLGGTGTKGAVVSGDGRILKRDETRTAAEGGAASVIDGIVRVYKNLSEEGTKPVSMGIGVPGLVDDETGEILFTPNLPLGGVNIAKELKVKCGCEVFLGNDANCAALGETTAGGAKGASEAVLVTLGTGIGGGIVLDKRLHTGSGGCAGEIGHMIINVGGRKCGCGRHGCWERYASATGLIITAREQMNADRGSLLWEMCGGGIDNINGRMIFDCYREGDGTAALIVERFIEHLAVGVVNLINILDPETICIGGGISNAWDIIGGPLREAVDAERISRFSYRSRQANIVRAELGNDAGVIGAAMLGAAGRTVS